MCDCVRIVKENIDRDVSLSQQVPLCVWSLVWCDWETKLCSNLFFSYCRLDLYTVFWEIGKACKSITIKSKKKKIQIKVLKVYYLLKNKIYKVLIPKNSKPHLVNHNFGHNGNSCDFLCNTKIII